MRLCTLENSKHVEKLKMDIIENGSEMRIMELSNIYKIEEATDLVKTNEMLESGWHLINTYIVSPELDSSIKNEVITYVLGIDHATLTKLERSLRAEHVPEGWEQKY
jgi:hypothetical protein